MCPVVILLRDQIDLISECCSSSSRSCHHVIVTEITAAFWKQSLQPVPFSLIMWWAALDNIDSLSVHIHASVCEGVFVQRLCYSLSFRFQPLHCVESAEWWYYICHDRSCSVVLSIYISSSAAKADLVCHSTSAFFWTLFPRIPCWCHLTITPLSTSPTGNVYFTPHAVMG